MKSHREQFPEQYTHPWVGRVMSTFPGSNVSGTVERVVSSRFGLLAILVETGASKAFALSTLTLGIKGVTP